MTAPDAMAIAGAWTTPRSFEPSQRGDREAFGVLVSRHAPLHSQPDDADAGADGRRGRRRAGNIRRGVQGAVAFSVRFEVLDLALSDCRRTSAPTRCGPAVPKTFRSTPAATKAPLAWETADEETPHWELEQAELAWELDTAIQALPHLYRESFVLKHIEGLGYDEMSAILGVHRDTLKMRVYKARTLLCQSLAHLDGAHR